MNRAIKFLICNFLLLFSGFNAAFAGGPLYLAGSGNNTPVVFADSDVNITLNYDQGNLGSRSNAEIDALVNQAITLWNNINTATIKLAQGHDLSEDVTVSNFSSVFNSYTDGLNPVIYDSNGEIIDAIFGIGAKNNILGFAASGYKSDTARLTEGRAVINGALSVSDTTLGVAFAHELGHFLGLDHTQLDGSQGLSPSNYPLMYPIAFRSQISAHEDDVAALTDLYPSANTNNYYGELRGRFQDLDTTPILGANIWAQELSSGKVYSKVSDYLTQGTGYFSMLLPTGTYSLHAESIQSNFNAASRVGPYTGGSSSISFRAPHPIVPVTFYESNPNSLYSIQIDPGCSIDITFVIEGGGYVSPQNCELNTLPVAENSELTTEEDTAITGILNASDADGDNLILRIITPPKHGQVDIINASTGAFSYIPNANEFGSDSFTFKANDGVADSNIATAIINITPVNDVPDVLDSDYITKKEIEFAGSFDASDADGDDLNFRIISPANLGDVVITNFSTGSFRYIPKAGVTGKDSFTFVASDGVSDSRVATIRITIYGFELVGDNRDRNTVQTGLWQISNALDPWQGESLYSNSGGTFRWLLDVPEGNYEIHTWWTYHLNRSTNVPYRIGHSNGIDTVVVNQNDPSLGGRWVMLGTYTLLPGNNTYIEVSSENGQASADAIRVVRLDDTDSDGDGLPDSFELNYGLDPTDPLDANLDLDDDGLSNITEYLNGTNPEIGNTATPSIQPDGGVFNDSVTVTLTSATPDSIIYYTVDGTTPEASSNLYQGPFLLSDSATVKARAWRSGYESSMTTSADFDIRIAASLTEVIVDNDDPDTAISGEWRVSGGANPWQGKSVYNNSGGVFRWLPELPQTGTYQVYAWWTYHENRSVAVPYRIAHLNGIDTVTVNQRDPAIGGQWILLGTYDFISGDSGYVEVSSESGQASADAIKLVLSTISNSDPDQDSDTDGMPDTFETVNGLDPNDPSDATMDKDNDGLSNLEEYQSGTSPILKDVITPTFNPVSGTYNDSVSVTIFTPTPGARIYYTTDGSIPTQSSNIYVSNINLFQNTTIKARAFLAGYVDSAINSAEFVINHSNSEIIIDNTDSTTQRVGFWKISSASTPWGIDSLYSIGLSTFRWTLDVPLTGNQYEVFAWWTSHANRSDNVPYIISHASGIDTVTVNQQDPDFGSRWISLGIYTFNSDTQDYIEISGINGQASADAVKLVPR